MAIDIYNSLAATIGKAIATPSLILAVVGGLLALAAIGAMIVGRRRAPGSGAA
jgi:hypothetical protein